MSGLRLADAAYERLRDRLLADAPLEACAIGFAHHDAATDTWVLREATPVPAAMYDERSDVSATLPTTLVVDAANRARRDGLSAVLIHTHPFAAGVPSFSRVDDAGEAELAAYFARRAPGGEHLALVIGPDGCCARRLGTKGEIPVWSVGSDLRRLSLAAEDDHGDHVRHDRQVRAFGMAGQRAIAALKVAVVGLGGTGSVLAQQLAHLGVRDIVLIDPDALEATNLNRVAGSRAADVGRLKVEIARDMIRAIQPRSRIEALSADVVDQEVALQLSGLDFIFLCTDSHASRAVVGQLAYQHLVPTIDMGVSVTVRDGAVTHITGRTQMLAPGLPCLTCTGALDGEQIRREMLSPEQRAADPYIIGANEPQPAVMSINSTMSSLAITMFLGSVTGMPANARFQRYDGVRGTVRPMEARRVEDCIVCSDAGALARGGGWPLPTRAKFPGGGRA